MSDQSTQYEPVFEAPTIEASALSVQVSAASVEASAPLPTPPLTYAHGASKNPQKEDKKDAKKRVFDTTPKPTKSIPKTVPTLKIVEKPKTAPTLKIVEKNPKSVKRAV